MAITLKTALKIARINQRQLAARAGVDESAISLIVNGHRTFASLRYESVVRIARVLNVDPDELFPVDDIVPAAATDSVAKS